MIMKIFYVLFFTIFMVAICVAITNKTESIIMPKRNLTTEENRVMMMKGTERPFTGKLLSNKAKGIYSCRNCGADLYESDDKFESHCGWPSFDDEIKGAVKRTTDADGSRVEITCENCDAHLGHVFVGEQLTDKNIRHCVNSVSLDFTPADWKPKKAYFAGGCFWGVEHYMQKMPGVISVVSGYSGGSVDNPTYKEVCSGKTGHLEVVEVAYNPYKVSFEELSKRFLEIHDPTQAKGQGPDIGSQYLSAIFYSDDDEKKNADELLNILRKKKMKIATKVIKFEKFWPAEDYHQNYYERKGTTPYCHSYKKLF
jgi:peptide methionine sulfoxide reductase msrA/msrB